MQALLLAAALIAAPQDRPAPPAGQPGAAPTAGSTANNSLDGNWTVVVCEKNGQVMTDKNMTVTVKGNVATFNQSGSPGAGADDKNRMRAMRFDVGPNGTIRVTEADASGNFSSATDRPGTGADRPGTTPPTGTTPPAPGTTPPAGTTPPTGTPSGDKFAPRPPGAAGTAMGGMKSGVYVLAGDYLAISVMDDMGGRPDTGISPVGGTDRPGAPAAGTAPPAGTDRPGDRPGAGTASTSNYLQTTRTYCDIVLKRADGGARPGDAPKP